MRASHMSLYRAGGMKQALFVWTLIVAFAALCVPGDPIGAQDTLPLFESGARVHLDAPSISAESITGRVVLSTSDSIGIQRAQYEWLYLSRSQLTRIQVTDRSHSRGAIKGAKVGAVISLGLVVLGIVRDARAPTPSDSWFAFSGAGAGVAIGTYVVMPAATIIGALLGSDRRETRWERP